MAATETNIQINGRKLIVRVFGDYIEIRRKGDRQGRTMPIDQLWRVTSGCTAEPPLTSSSKNRIVAVFQGIKGSKSLWQRQDTGEVMTEAKIMAQGRKERRPVVTLFGMPPKAMAAGGGS